MTTQIFLPDLPGLPIVAINQQSSNHKPQRKAVTLKEVKDAVFAAVLRGDLVIGERVIYADTAMIHITMMSREEADKRAKEYGFTVEVVSNE